MNKCNCGCSDDNKVLVDGDLFDAMVVELEDTLQINSTNPPSFKPNKDLGEGIASKRELEIRGKILSYLEELYKYVDSILQSDISYLNKKQLINKSVVAFIQDAQSSVKKEIEKSYNDGKKLGESKLKELDLKVEKTDDLILEILIQQQLDNIEALGMEIKYKLYKQMNLGLLFEFYG